MHQAQECTYSFQLHKNDLILFLTMILLKLVPSFYTYDLTFSSDDTRHFVSARSRNYRIHLYTSLNIDFVVMLAGHSETKSFRFRCPFIENPS